MKTTRSDLKFARTQLIFSSVLLMLAIAGAAWLGLYITRPPEPGYVFVYDGGRAMLGYLVILAMGLVTGGLIMATVVFATYYRSVKRRLLQVADGTVDGD